MTISSKSPQTLNALEKANIGGLRFVFQSESCLERLFWFLVITIGTIVASFLIRRQLSAWSEDNITSSMEQRHLSNVPFPAITLCHPGYLRFDFVAKYLNLMDPVAAHKKFEYLRVNFIKQAVREHNTFKTNLVHLTGDYQRECEPRRRKLYNVTCSIAELTIFAALERNVSFEAMSSEFALAMVRRQKGSYDTMRDTFHQITEDAEKFMTRHNLTLGQDDMVQNYWPVNPDELYYLAWMKGAFISFGLLPSLGMRQGEGREVQNALFTMNSTRAGSFYSALYGLYTMNVFTGGPNATLLTLDHFQSFSNKFKIKGSVLSAIDWISLLFTRDYMGMSRKKLELVWDDFWTKFVQAKTIIATLPEEAKACIRAVQAEFPDSKSFESPSPCSRTNGLSSTCSVLCSIFEKLSQDNSPSKIMAILKNGLHQNGLMPQQNLTQIEEAIYRDMFPEDPINLERDPMLRLMNLHPLVVYCRNRQSEAWRGTDIGYGLNNRFCRDFFTSPTDLGFCSTKNWQASQVLDPGANSPFFETFGSSSDPVQFAHANIREGVVTLVIDTHRRETLATENVPILENTEAVDSVQLQLHEVTSVAQMLTSQDFSRDMETLTLKSGHEYFIAIEPRGHDVTKRFKDHVDFSRQPCHLDTLRHNLSLFQTYSYTNCYYECRVRMTAEICACVPWDFLSGLGQMPMCDVFGTTCFRNVMLNLTTRVDWDCHCPKACDAIEYAKRVEQVLDMDQASNGWYPRFFTCGKLCEYLLKSNGTIHDPTLDDVKHYHHEYSHHDRDTQGSRIFRDMIVVHLQFNTPRFDVTVLDSRVTDIEKLAEFGGTWGLVTQLTGFSFLAVIQILVFLGKLAWRRLLVAPAAPGD